jgi:hypothetical protein
MIVATQSFLDGLEAWVKALRAEDFKTAKVHAEICMKRGDLLIIHPDFIRCFKVHTNGGDPKEALSKMCDLLTCATQARERHNSNNSNNNPGSDNRRSDP